MLPRALFLCWLICAASAPAETVRVGADDAPAQRVGDPPPVRSDPQLDPGVVLLDALLSQAIIFAHGIVTVIRRSRGRRPRCRRLQHFPFLPLRAAGFSLRGFPSCDA